MGKRSDTFETVLLAIELLRRVPRNRKVTAADLHRQLQDAGITRDVRTIQRQLEMLTEHFNLARDDRSKPYGYQWPEHASGLSLPKLTLQESLLLRLAEEQLRFLLPAHLMKSMENFFAQARHNLGPSSSEAPEKEWLGKVRVVATSQPLLPPKIAPYVFEAVCEGLYANRWLDLEYKNAAGRQSQIEVMPLGLAQQGPRLYLVCRYKDYNNERLLALHRIQSARVSTLQFKRPKSFNLKRFDDEGRFGFGEGKHVRLTFRITKPEGDHLLETPLSLDQSVKEFDDFYEISATVVDSAMLSWWLNGFGEAASRIRKRTITA